MDTKDYAALANQFVNATKTAAGDNLLIIQRGVSPESNALAEACKLGAIELGAGATILPRGSAYLNGVLEKATPDDLIRLGKEELELVKPFTTNINIGEDHDLLGVAYDQADYKKAMKDAMDHRINNARWLVVRSPSPQFAESLGMKPDEFKDFYTKVCLADYTKMEKSVVPLKDLMDKTTTVRITGEDTDLSFTKKNLLSYPCVGVRNIPDGECYTAPEKNSINGRIKFGPSNYNGKKFTSIALEFAQGKVIKATGGSDKETIDLNAILDTDEGARYAGEFAVGFNPYITQSVGDILFDEKRAKSIHIALGQAFQNGANNGNDSAIHWDMIAPDVSLWFDDVLIRDKGIFTLPELQGLNPENLMN